MGMRPTVAVLARIEQELEAQRASAEPDPITVVQRRRRDRAHLPCATCTHGDTSPAAIANHNLRCAETGERSYPRPRVPMRSD